MADNKFLPNGDNPRRARHFQSVAPTHRMNNSRGPTKDVLTGFDCPFLDSRSITFAYPLSNGRVCAGCSMVPAIAVRLPCAHILCGSCALDAVARLSARATAANHDGLCPEEGAPFLKSELEVVTFPVEILWSQTVLCVNAGFGCTFHAKLRHLPGHLRNGCHVSHRASPHLRELGCSGRVKCGHWLRAPLSS
ncbi:hypothetical protein MRX96_026186 [Rhipicephalus microplus]